MKINIHNGYTLTSDGREYRLDHSDGSFPVPASFWADAPPRNAIGEVRSETRPAGRGKTRTVYMHDNTRAARSLSFSSLNDATKSMLAFGIISETEAQRGWGAREVCRRLAERMDAVIGEGKSAATERKAIVSFDGGRFNFYPYSAEGYHGWRLENPARDVVRINNSDDNVGYVSNLFDAFTLASDRNFKSTDLTIDYTDTNNTNLDLTSRLFADASVRFNAADLECGCKGKCSGHAINAYSMTPICKIRSVSIREASRRAVG